MILRAMFYRRWLLTTLLVVLGAAVCVRLGIWQLDRLEQRRAFNAHVLAMRALPPLDLDNPGSADLASQEYRAATVTGTYDFAHQVAIRNQVWTDPVGHIDLAGYHLLTPLILNDGETAVLVDRGWVPAEGNQTPEGWPRYDQTGLVTLSGILRPGRSRPDFGGVPDPDLAPGQTRLDFWNMVNIERIDAQTPYELLPVYLQLDPQPEQTEPPYPYQPEIELTEGPHAGYAGQWFTFATILLVGYPFYLRRQEKEAI